MLVGDLAAKLLRFLAAIALARALTLEGFGLVNAAIAVSGVATVLATVGLTDIGVRDVALAPHTIKAVASRVVTIRLCTIAVALTGSVAVALVIDPEYLGLVFGGGAMAVGMSVSGEWALRGLERMRWLAFASIAGALTVAIGALLIGLVGGGPVIALCAFALGEAVLAAATWIGVGRAGWPRPTLGGAGPMLRRSWPVGAASLIVYSYYANVDTIILASTRSSAEAGLYSAPYRMFLVLNVVAVFAAYAAFPTLSRASDAALESDARILITRILELLLCYGFLVVGCVHLFGAAALGWLFGSRFEAMEATFALLSLAVAWYVDRLPRRLQPDSGPREQTLPRWRGYGRSAEPRAKPNADPSLRRGGGGCSDCGRVCRGQPRLAPLPGPTRRCRMVDGCCTWFNVRGRGLSWRRRRAYRSGGRGTYRLVCGVRVGCSQAADLALDSI